MSVVNEIKLKGRAFRKLIDRNTNRWLTESFWTAASDVEFEDGETAETKFASLKNQINNLVQSFQDGVNKIFKKLQGLGFTPNPNSPDGICNAIDRVYNDRYNQGVTRGRQDVIDNPSAYGVSTTSGLVSFNGNIVSGTLPAGTYRIDGIMQNRDAYGMTMSVYNETDRVSIVSRHIGDDATDWQHPQIASIEDHRITFNKPTSVTLSTSSSYNFEIEFCMIGIYKVL